MKIKITIASDSSFWYNKHIGEQFPVIKEEADRYWTREPDGYRCLNFVLKKDCEVVDGNT